MLAHDVAGEGPAILLVHEGISDRRMWEPQVAPLVAGGYRVVRCDLPGFGDSELTPGPFSNLDELHELLAQLGIDQVSLIGGSFGARVSLEYALTYPEQVDALVLMVPGLRDVDWSDELRQSFEEEDALVEAGDLEAAVELNLRVWVDGPARKPDQVDPAVRESVREMVRRSFELQLAVPEAGPAESFDPPASARLGEIRFPVLIVVGDLDQPDILRVADRLAEGIPEARKEVIPGTAHVPSMEKPEEFNRLVLNFLQTA